MSDDNSKVQIDGKGFGDVFDADGNLLFGGEAGEPHLLRKGHLDVTPDQARAAAAFGWLKDAELSDGRVKIWRP